MIDRKLILFSSKVYYTDGSNVTDGSNYDNECPEGYFTCNLSCVEWNDENAKHCVESAFSDFFKEYAGDLFLAVVVIITGILIIVTIICRTKHRQNPEELVADASSVVSVPAMKSSTLLHDGSIRFFEVTDGNELTERESTFL